LIFNLTIRMFRSNLSTHLYYFYIHRS